MTSKTAGFTEMENWSILTSIVERVEARRGEARVGQVRGVVPRLGVQVQHHAQQPRQHEDARRHAQQRRHVRRQQHQV